MWACLLMLLAWVPGRFVVCIGPNCDNRIEFAHVGCCDCDSLADAHEARDPGTPNPLPIQSGRGCGCKDVALSLGLGPTPKRWTGDNPDAPLACLVPPAVAAMGVTAPNRCVCRPSTGPPRVDRRTELLASTVLLI